jgi:hypothetical protein
MFGLEADTIAIILTFISAAVGTIYRDLWTRRKAEDERNMRDAERAAELKEIVDRATAEAEAVKIAAQAAVEKARLEAQAVAERLLIENRKNISLVREDVRKNTDYLEAKFEEVKTLAEEGKVINQQQIEASNHNSEKFQKVFEQLGQQASQIDTAATVGLEKTDAIRSIAEGNVKRLETIKDTVTRIDERTTTE